jgi:glycerol-3-phosphate dehydrogenase
MLDVAVIGGGVVGIAIARQYVLQGARVILFEKEKDVLLHASGSNSSLLHCGFDANPALLEARLVREGFSLWVELLEQLGVVRPCGGLVVAWSEEEAAQLPALSDKAHRNGCFDVQILSRAETLAKCSGLAASACGSLFVPREYVADSWVGALLLLHQALEMGLVLKLGAKVTSVTELADGRLELNGAYRARLVVNAAGIFADQVEAMRPGGPLIHLKSRPRLGQFVVFEADKRCCEGLPCVVYPVPNQRTKGVVMWRNLGNSIIVGPTATDSTSRVAAVDETTTAALVRVAQERLRDGDKLKVVARYAGVRPATEEDDYRIAKGGAWICVAGIRSTGFTASLAIARHVAGVLDGSWGAAVGREDARWHVVPEELRSLTLQRDGRLLVRGISHTPHPQTLLRLRAKL